MSKIVEGIAKDLKSIPEKLKAKTGNIDKKKLFLMNLPYALAGYFCDKIAWLWRNITAIRSNSCIKQLKKRTHRSRNSKKPFRN